MKILAVGRGFVGTALARDVNVDVVSHTDPFKHNANFDGYAAVVNCAGIAGERKCREAAPDDVQIANVHVPTELFYFANEIGAVLFHLSTTGMYRPQTCPVLEGFQKPNEESRVAPYNAYVKSKLVAEKHLVVCECCYVLRVPMFEDGVRAKAKDWDSVQDTYLSLTSPTHLLSVIRMFLEKRPEFGLYNISEKVVYLPDFIKSLGIDIPIETQVRETMTSAVPISTQKIERCISNGK